MNNPTLTFILGGARSGKSRLAEKLALDSALPVTYIATATAGDDEMRARIAIHQARRPAHWALVEEPLALADVLLKHAQAGHFVLVDCLTLWLSNLLFHPDPSRFDAERQALLAALPKLAGRIVLVSNETGLGIMPLGAITRRFCDESGWLHQDIAEQCQRVIFTIAGLSHVLKDET